MTKQKQTGYVLDIKNPYLGKGDFLWKHNDDSKLGEESFSEWASRKTPYDEKASHEAGRERARIINERMGKGFSAKEAMNMD